jgi:hypothetical protein
VLLVPFVAYALPYAIAMHRGSAGAAPAVFTVDEPLYLAQARSIATGLPADENPWTHRRGTAPDAYRLFGGSMAIAALCDAAGFDPTFALAIAAGLCAALASAAAMRTLSVLLRGPAAASAWILAPLVALGPWDSLGEFARLHPDFGRLETFHALARPFTTQWGPCLYLASLACAARVLDRPALRTVLAFTAVLAAQFFTFPYAVPVALLVWTTAVLRSPPPPTPSASRRLALAIPWASAALLAVVTVWLQLPAAAEANHGTVVSPRFGGAGILVAVAGALAWWRRACFPPALRAFLPSVALALVLAMLAGHVVPGRLHVIEHVAYLYGVTIALLTLSLLATASRRQGHPAPRAVPVAIALVAVATALVNGVSAAHAHEPAQQRRAALAEALRALPREGSATLLCEGEDLDGPGAWSAFLGSHPLFYSYTSEYSTMVSLEDRRWRRAWYLHFRGLTVADVDREGAGIVARYPRFFGAHNTVPASELLAAMRELLRRIEAREPAATEFLRSIGDLLCLEHPRSPTFRDDLLTSALTTQATGHAGEYRLTLYAAKAP